MTDPVSKGTAEWQTRLFLDPSGSPLDDAALPSSRRRAWPHAGWRAAPPAPLGGGQTPGRWPRRRRRAFGAPTTQTRYDDYTGFTKIFDGKTFTNWNGERDVWSIVDGLLHADTTKTPGQHHVHYTGPGAVMRDFTLKVEVKLSADRRQRRHPVPQPPAAPGARRLDRRSARQAAAGQHHDDGRGGRRGDHRRARGARRRSRRRRWRTCGAGGARRAAGRRWRRAGGPGARSGGAARRIRVSARSAISRRLRPRGAATPRARADRQSLAGQRLPVRLDSDNQYTGQLYEGQGRNIITAPGTIGMLLPGNCKILLGKLPGDAKAAIKPHQGLDGEWQQVEIIVRGNTMIHVLNGQVMSITVDDDPVARAPQGILSLQLEGSGQIWYRNVYLKQQDKSLDFPR